MDKMFDEPIVLDERYFGETKEISDLFEIYSRFRQRWMSITLLNFGVSKDPDLKLFCDKCCELWGFETFSYIIIQSPVVNSFTFGTDLAWDLTSDPQKLVEYTSSGIRFKKSAKVNVIVGVYTGLFMSKDFTDREAFAVFLHEIGHNFQYIMNKNLGLLSTIKIPIMIIRLINGLTDLSTGEFDKAKINFKSVITSSNASKAVINNITNYVKSTPVLSELSDVFSLFTNIPQIKAAIITSITKPISIPMVAITHILSKLSSLILTPLYISRYGWEQIADSFAADLGYGKDMVSYELKGTRKGRSTDLWAQIPIINALVDLWCAPFYAIIYALDEHPTSGARIKGTMDIMKNDLKNGYVDPKMRKSLEKDIADMEKELKIFEENTKTFSTENKHIFSQLILLATVYSLDGGFKYNLFKNFFNHSEEKEAAYQRSIMAKESYDFLKDVKIK